MYPCLRLLRVCSALIPQPTHPNPHRVHGDRPHDRCFPGRILSLPGDNGSESGSNAGGSQAGRPVSREGSTASSTGSMLRRRRSSALQRKSMTDERPNFFKVVTDTELARFPSLSEVCDELRQLVLHESQ